MSFPYNIHFIPLWQVNDRDMTNSTHHDAVGLLKEITDVCKLVVSREVLVVMPEDLPSVAGNIEHYFVMFF